MDKEKTRWYKEAIIYQIYPFSYMDSNNDGMGDIKGIISKLDYIKDLGVTAIWFSPLYDSPNHDYGYDVRDYYKISEAFGTMDDFKKLLEEAHKRNLKVIMDFVANHTSNEHKWFKDVIENPESQYKDYYIIRKGIERNGALLPPNNWTSTFTGSAWERLPGSEDEFYLHLFTKEQPDLNWDNPKVREEIKKIFKFYLDMGVDGFRLDVVNIFSKVEGLPSDNAFGVKGMKYYVDGPHIHEYLHEVNEDVISKYDSMTVGETMKVHDEDALLFVSEESGELDTIFNFSHLTSDSISGLAVLPKKFNLLQFKEGMTGPQEKLFGKGWNTLVLENHDQPRSNSRFSFDTANFRYEISTMLPLMMFMQWGTPFIFEGEEIGMTNANFDNIDQYNDPVSHYIYDLMKKYFFPKKLIMKCMKKGARDNARTPMQWSSDDNAGFSKGTPWQAVNPNYKEINVEADLKSDNSIIDFYKKVIAIKKENKTAIYGDFKEYNHADRNTYSYSRTLDTNHLFVVANFKNTEEIYKIPSELLKEDLKAVLSNCQDTAIKDSAIVLAPYQATLYSYKDAAPDSEKGSIEEKETEDEVKIIGEGA